jgi:outer membrane biosynthesis protein TonB
VPAAEAPRPEPEPEPEPVAVAAANPAPVPRAKPRVPAPEPEPEPEPEPRTAEDDPLARQIAEEQQREPEPEQQTREFDPERIAALIDDNPAGGRVPSESPASLGVDEGRPSAAMTQNELDALRARIKDCWFPPLGWSDPAEVRVRVRMALNPDGTLSGAPVVLEAPSGTYSRRAPESALTALRRCAPYDLPPEKYETWREVEIRFDPIEMFR